MYQHSNAPFAALAANTVAEEYTQQNIDLRLANIEKTLKWLGEELKRYEDAAALRASRAVAIPRGSQRRVARGEAESRHEPADAVERHVDQGANERVSKQAIYDQLKGADPSSDNIDNFPVIGSNTGVVEAKNNLALLNAQRWRAMRGQLQAPNIPR